MVNPNPMKIFLKYQFRWYYKEKTNDFNEKENDFPTDLKMVHFHEDLML